MCGLIQTSMNGIVITINLSVVNQCLCAITTEHARVDLSANGFWSGAQDAYFDVRVFHPNAPSNAGSISSAYKKHWKIPKNEHTDNALTTQFGTLTSLLPHPRVYGCKLPYFVDVIASNYYK